MHPALFYESFFFCPRDDLERLQPLSQTLLDIIVGGSNMLPLRPIYCVSMDFDEDSKDTLQIFLEEDEDADEELPVYEASIRDGDFAQTFLRLQNVFVKYFNVGIRDSPFLDYWKSQEAACFAVERIDFDSPTEYDLLDSIVNHLRPRRVYFSDEEPPFNGEDLKLLARDSFLNNLQICRLTVRDDSFAISSFVLSERGYSNYELECRHSDVMDGIDGLIESFVREGCANKRLQSVCIEWEDGDGPQSSAPKRLSKPTKTDEPLPKIGLTKWLTNYSHRVTQCEKYCFVNKTQWKRMEVHKWTVEYDYDDDRRTSHVLQCRVMSL
ncbi:hypothetical protein AAVH_24484 [Aphelenchoides avenae]|nr:hypothetical protein AAVH_24484 [Aphelenchus avenae]